MNDRIFSSSLQASDGDNVFLCGRFVFERLIAERNLVVNLFEIILRLTTRRFLLADREVRRTIHIACQKRLCPLLAGYRPLDLERLVILTKLCL